VRQFEDIAKERPEGVRVRRVDERMRPGDH
jgi:hypothetical protein